jgi:hypothetical protein
MDGASLWSANSAGTSFSQTSWNQGAIRTIGAGWVITPNGDGFTHWF